MRCGECAVWRWSWDHWPDTQDRWVMCRRRITLRSPWQTCDRTSADLRRDADWLRSVADALDKAAEMREREEGSTHAVQTGDRR